MKRLFWTVFSVFFACHVSFLSCFSTSKEVILDWFICIYSAYYVFIISALGPVKRLFGTNFSAFALLILCTGIYYFCFRTSKEVILDWFICVCSAYYVFTISALLPVKKLFWTGLSVFALLTMYSLFLL